MLDLHPDACPNQVVNSVRTSTARERASSRRRGYAPKVATIRRSQPLGASLLATGSWPQFGSSEGAGISCGVGDGFVELVEAEGCGFETVDSQ